VPAFDIIMLMRTTLTLNDDVLKMARQRAARENRPVRDIINESLRVGLTAHETRKRKGYVFRLKVVPGRVMPGVDLNDRDKLFDIMDGR